MLNCEQEIVKCHVFVYKSHACDVILSSHPHLSKMLSTIDNWLSLCENIIEFFSYCILPQVEKIIKFDPSVMFRTYINIYFRSLSSMLEKKSYK